MMDILLAPLVGGSFGIVLFLCVMGIGSRLVEAVLDVRDAVRKWAAQGPEDPEGYYGRHYSYSSEDLERQSTQRQSTQPEFFELSVCLKDPAPQWIRDGEVGLPELFETFLRTQRDKGWSCSPCEVTNIINSKTCPECGAEGSPASKEELAKLEKALGEGRNVQILVCITFVGSGSTGGEE